MTADLFDRAATDDEELIVAWLTPLGRTSIVRRSGESLPFRRVEHVAGNEDVDREVLEAVVQINTLADKANGWRAARDEAELTHLRMLELAKFTDPVTLSDHTEVSVDYCRVFEPPRWTPSGDDQILQKTGRYLIGLSYVLIS